MKIAGCRTPLRLIFWGALICVLDFKLSSVTNGRGFQVDVINDFVGMVLIVAGLFRITRLRLDDRWHGAMIFVSAVAVLACLRSLAEHFVFPRPEALYWVESAFGLLDLAAILVFCAAMRAYSRGAGLAPAAASWKTTFLLFLFIYTIPLGGVIIAGMVATLAGSRFNIDLGLPGLLLLPLFLWPLIHFFVSTSRMTRAVTPGAEEGLVRPA